MLRLPPRQLAYLMLAVVMLLWAGNSIVARAVRGEIPPLTLAFLRWSLGSLVFLPFSLPHVLRERRAILAAWKPILLLGLLGVAAFNAFLYSGLRHTSASNGLLLQAAIPALVLAFNRLLFRVRPERGDLIGVALAVLGVAVIMFRGDLAAIAGLAFGRGDLLVLCAVVAWALYTTLLRLRPAIHPASFLAVTFLIGAATMGVLAITEWQEVVAIRWTPATLAAVGYVAIFPSVIAYALFNAAVQTLGAGKAGQAITLMPLFGAFLAAATLGEALLPFHWVGMACILGGILVSAVSLPRRG
ncbi:DMT family transporter [Sphingomonas sp. ac-8]|uniref:DMT family transporter n=1 Tax=Sphingomonas sp. ac-8 TaxID=3242977 RepID=UPI003A7FCE76